MLKLIDYHIVDYYKVDKLYLLILELAFAFINLHLSLHCKINIEYFFDLNIGRFNGLDLVDLNEVSLFCLFSVILIIQTVLQEYILMVFFLRNLLFLLDPK